MSHGYFGHTRPLLAFALVCGATLSLAYAVRAGVVLPVDPPFTDSVCLDPSDVTGALTDPNAFYAGRPQCESLCKKAGADCAQYVKLASVCQKSEIGDDASYSKKECEVEFEHGTATTVCKTEIEHGARDARSGALTNRNSALDACDAWEHTCEATCH
jgi:hypothetical protein